MSSSIKIRILNKTLDISFDEGDCAKDICASLSIKGYPADFQLVRDDKLPLDKWAPLDPKQVYNFLPSTPKKTTEPTQASPAIPIQEPTQASPATQASPPPNPEPSHLQEASQPYPRNSSPSRAQNSRQTAHQILFPGHIG